MKKTLKRLIPFVKGYKKEFVLSFLGMAAAAIGTSATAYLVKPVLDEIFINKDRDMLQILPWLVILVYFLKGAGRYVQTYFTNYIGQDIIRHLRDLMLENILRHDMAFFNKQRTGELISRIVNDITRIQNVVSTMIPVLLRELLTILALTGVVIYQSPRLALFSLIALPLALYPLRRLAKRMKQISIKTQEKISDITSRLTEIFNNIEMIKASASEEHEAKRFAELGRSHFMLNMKGIKTQEAVSPLMETLGAIAVALVIIVGGNEVIDGRMSVGSFFSFMSALFMLYTPIKSISSIYNNMQDAVAAGERIFTLLDVQPKIISGMRHLASDIREIKFEGVDLAYDGLEALKEINLTARKGEVIALVGDSGGGKSSLINLIVRFYDPTRGRILLDGVDLRDYNLKELRDQIALVTQRIFIFNDTIAANVSYGAPYQEERVILALKQANAYEFVGTLEKGIHTHLDEFGANLSGGQRQRIALARAIYKNPQILILDEATSALDTKSEAKIQEALASVTRDKITFIVAHRLSTIQKADKIVVLKKGRIVCRGRHEELLDSCEEYCKLAGTFAKKSD